MQYTKKAIPAALRNTVWNEYNGVNNSQSECYVGCGTIISMQNFECGHIEAERFGGQTTLSNLRPICSTCNKSMGTKNMLQFCKDTGMYSRSGFNEANIHNITKNNIQNNNINNQINNQINQWKHRVDVLNQELGSHPFIYSFGFRFKPDCESNFQYRKVREEELVELNRKINDEEQRNINALRSLQFGGTNIEYDTTTNTTTTTQTNVDTPKSTSNNTNVIINSNKQTCSVCHRNNHTADNCYAKSYVDGTPILSVKTIEKTFNCSYCHKSFETLKGAKYHEMKFCNRCK